MDFGFDERIVTTREKLRTFGEVFYMIALIIYMVSQFVPGTMFPSLLPALLPYRITQLSGMLVIVKMILFDFEIDDGKWKEWLIYIFLGLILWKTCSDAYQYNLYYYYLFVIGAQNIDYKKLLKVFLITLSSLILVTVFAAKLRFIPGLTMGRYGTPTVRYALGMIYPSDLAARAFYLMLAYCVYKKFKLVLPEYIACLAFTIFIYIMTDTKLDALLMIMVIAVAALYPYVKKLIYFVGGKVIVLLTLLATGSSVLLTYFYTPHNKLMLLLNRVLSDRLKYGHMAFKNYNVSIFGQYIPQRGNGGIHVDKFKYFFIDSSYVRHLMMNGLIAFTVVMVILCIMLTKFTKRRAYSLVVYLLFVVVSSIIDQHMLEISFNFVFIAFLADIRYFEADNASKSRSLLKEK